MTSVTLTAGESSAWFNMGGFVGSDVVFNVVVAGGGIAAINVSNDEDDAHPDAINAVESFSSSTARVLQRPIPDFVQIKNTGSGTVKFTIGRGVEQVTAVPPPTE